MIPQGMPTTSFSARCPTRASSTRSSGAGAFGEGGGDGGDEIHRRSSLPETPRRVPSERRAAFTDYGRRGAGAPRSEEPGGGRAGAAEPPRDTEIVRGFL